MAEVAPYLIRYDDIEPANFFALAEKLMKVQSTLHDVHYQLTVEYCDPDYGYAHMYAECGENPVQFTSLYTDTVLQ